VASIKVSTCDICRDPGKSAQSVAIGDPAFQTRICPLCARHAAVSLWPHSSETWLFVLASGGQLLAHLSTQPKSLGAAARERTLETLQDELAAIGNRS
jgi:hypothetical protein